jgi:PAT family beta-lactamase induction signal transducer AmpG
MAFGLMIPGMFSGWVQETLGYQHFFVWILLTMIPGYFIIKALKIDPEFGKKIEN